MQNTRFSGIIRALIVLVDIALIILFIWLYNCNTETWSDANLASVLILIFIWMLIGARTQLYQIPRMLTFTSFVERIFFQLILFGVGCYLISLPDKNAFDISSRSFLLAFSAAFILMKTVLFFSMKIVREMGYNHRNVMFLEDTGASYILSTILQKRKDYGFRIFKFNEEFTEDNLQKFWKQNGIHTLYLPLTSRKQPDLVSLIRLADKFKVKVSFVPDILSEEFATYELTYAETQPLLQRGHFPLEFWTNAFLKRSIDIIISLLFFIFIAGWLFPIIALLIKKDSKGSIFFRQKRYGQHDRTFFCYKFRTMVPNSESNTATTARNDCRITKIGHLLRKTNLDELPQFYNVLKGDMSVVGPRPHMLAVDDHYRKSINYYSIRNAVRPGITGLAQIEGLRGDTHEDMQLHMEKRILADAFYVKNWSLSMDFIIMVKTILLSFRGDKKVL